MITRLKLTNYKCFETLDLRLPRFGVLIGPNNSGKSSILDALVHLSMIAKNDLAEVFKGAFDLGKIAWAGSKDRLVEWDVEFAGPTSGNAEGYSLSVVKRTGGGLEVSGEAVKVAGAVYTRKGGSFDFGKAGIGVGRAQPIFSVEDWVSETVLGFRELVRAIRGMRRYAFDAEEIKKGSPISVGKQGLRDESGYGLAAVLDWMKVENLDAFLEIQKALQAAFADVREVVIQRADTNVKTQQAEPEPFEDLPRDELWCHIAFRMKQGWIIPAALASSGMLLYLAYLTVVFSPDRPELILVEEPENGNHPRRLNEIMDVLRKLSEGSEGVPPIQVLMTTHSPYLLDLVGPDEIFVVTRDEEGKSTARPFAQVEKLKERLVDFSPGELWYGLGEDQMFPPKGKRRK
jgi:predicted ATPase